MITVVLPHRARRDLLERALAACGAWPVIVADDTDDGLDLDVPKVRCGGFGFARAVNAGLARVRTPAAVVLNDDAAPLGDCLFRLARTGGLCGPVLVGPGGVESRGMRMRLWRAVQVQGGPIDALSGACLHVPADARFDERFRHGGEDVELCLRLGGARLVAEARCWHEGGATIDRRSVEAQRHAVAGQLRLVRGWRRGIVAALAVAQVAREGPASRIRGVVEGWGDARS